MNYKNITMACLYFIGIMVFYTITLSITVSILSSYIFFLWVVPLLFGLGYKKDFIKTVKDAHKCFIGRKFW